MHANRYAPVKVLEKSGTSGLTTDTGASVSEVERRPVGLMGALIIRAIAGSTPSITGKIQHSPSDASITDANAIWLDLLTFTAQTAVGAQTQSVQTPYFPRLRGVVTRGGTTVTNLDYTVVVV